ncbi:unnamed protein product [Urochloa decumbens]|uniref:Bowman-Birk serine protease inhibitors family domain-containing protein n=1 Tax=Urochloa decumbens TaxID=240449 RepID=A0ABC8XMQ8_9POAL
MRGGRCDGLVYVMVVFWLIVLYASYTQCGRPTLPEARTTRSPTNTTATMVDSTALLGERNIVLVFCKKATCESNLVCYCCLNHKPKELCYDTMDECRSNCVVCRPVCPPAQTSHQKIVEGRPSHVTTNSTLDD